MSSETITRNDIVAILNKTIPGQGTDMSAQGVEDFIDDLNLAPSDYVKLSELGDYVIEQGTSGIWTYRKWCSGLAECWSKQTVSVNFATQVASNFRMTTTATSTSYPDIFTSIGCTQCSASHSTNNTWLTVVSGQVDATNKTINCGFFGWNTGGTQPVIFSIYITGTWK